MATFSQEGDIFFIEGVLTQQRVKELWSTREQLIGQGVQYISLAKLAYCDSAGIAFIIELIGQYRAKQQQVYLCSASAQVAKLIALYDLSCFFSEDEK